MEQEKNKNGVNLLLVFVTIILAILCVLFATDTINFKSNSVNNNNKNSNNTIESNINNEVNNQNSTDNLYSTTEIDKKTLDQLYHIIGALPESGEEVLAPRHCLNVAVTNTTYLGTPYAGDVFSWYVIAYKKQANYEKYKDAIYSIDGIKTSAYHCAACFIIEKSEVEKFKQLYYFGPEEEFKFIKDTVENYDNIYEAVHSLGSPVHCDYNVKHNITKVNVEKRTEGEIIYLTDKQIVTRYDNDDIENDDISQLTKQTINYSFYRKNGNNVYQLNHVFHRNKVK